MGTTVTASELIKLYDQDQRFNLTDPRYEREVEAGVVRHITHKPGRFGFVIYSYLDEEGADLAIQTQIRRFSELGSNFEWKLFEHDQPPDLLARLERHGFTIEEAESILVLDLEQAGEALESGRRKPPAGIQFCRIRDMQALADIVKLEEAVWEEQMGWLKGDLGELLQKAPDYLSVYLAVDGDQPVSAAWSFFAPGSRFVGLYGGATLPAYRGAGLYSTLLELRAQEARQRGRRFLTVDASEMSRPILLRRGFRLMGISHPCNWLVDKGS